MKNFTINMEEIHEVSLVKYDLLGLKNIEIIKDTCELAHIPYPKSYTVNWNDQNVWNHITDSPVGIFQFESKFAFDSLKKFHCHQVNDLSLINASIRPSGESYRDRLLAHEPNKNPSELIDELLAGNHGYLVFQEDVIAFLQNICGLSGSEADNVRRAIGRKQMDRLQAALPQILEGYCNKSSKPREEAEKEAKTFLQIIEDSSNYMFGYNHSTGYSMIGYMCGYLRYYYPKEFMAALMSSVMDNVSKFSEYILTCRRMMDIAILPPDINEGESGFSVSGDGIRYGLSAIKSVGRPVVDAILEERKKNGIFSSMEDFINRMTNKEVNRRTIENFIKSGAMDSLPGTRRQKVAVAPILLDNKARERKNAWEGQMSLFDLVSEEEKKEYQVSFPDVGEYSKEELLAFEKDILGVYISGHPLDDYEGLWRKNITATSADFIVDEETEEAVVKDGMKVVIGGLVAGKVVKTTRSNQLMAFITLEDLMGSVEVIVFPKNYEADRDVLTEDSKIFIKGRVSLGDEPVGKLVCEQVIPFSKVPRQLWLQFEDKEIYQAMEGEILGILKESEGPDSVVIYLKKERAKKILPANWKVEAAGELMETLICKLGEKNVKLVEKNLINLGK